jgi:glycosyltransferase involved in cell wall biosynthesis
MEALIISAGEPQVERCLEAARSQTVPFSNIIHIANVVPEHVAFNTGIDKITDEWLMKIDGDMILHKDAVEIVLKYMSGKDDVSMFTFTVYDDFFAADMVGCNVAKTSLFKTVRYRNMLRNDFCARKSLTKMGLKRDKPAITIATHAENPDEFQIFRRFYIYGVKYGKGFGPWRHASKMLSATGDERYRFALRALEFGMTKAYYPGSHNIDFDKKMFGEFKEIAWT